MKKNLTLSSLKVQRKHFFNLFKISEKSKRRHVCCFNQIYENFKTFSVLRRELTCPKVSEYKLQTNAKIGIINWFYRSTRETNQSLKG